MQTPDNFTARVGRWSAQHRKKAIFGWLAFVLVSLFIGMNLVPQKEIDQNSAGPGESGQAAKALDGAFRGRVDRAGADSEQAARGRRRAVQGRRG